MLNNYKCIIDTHCEVYDFLKSWADDIFWDLANHEFVPNSIYMIGREQFRLNLDKIKQAAYNNTIKIVLSNPAEGSETILHQILGYGIEELVRKKKILILNGGDLDTLYPYLKYESFMVKIFDYVENVQAANNNFEIYQKLNKPYSFLFLNGRDRWHRRELIKLFIQKNLLDYALWTCLDKSMGPIKTLPPEYEVPRFKKNTIAHDKKFVKDSLFNNTWGDVYLYLPPYIDTYFSVVTETVFRYPYSFRTEKIWKPIVIGHPWIAVANRGFYRDLKAMGFKTFAPLIDESFDQIDNDLDRLTQISNVVNDLCYSKLDEFMQEAKDICKYNQLHFCELRKTEIKNFPSKLENFIQNNWPYERPTI